MNNALIYHHIDLDGYTSAAQIIFKLKEEKYETIDTIAINYPEPDKFPYPKYNYDTIYIVDTSFSKDTFDCLLKIRDYAKNVIWIDHHKTSIDLVQTDNNYSIITDKNNVTLIIDSKVCASVLSYLYRRFGLSKIESSVEIIFSDICRGVSYDELKPSTKIFIPKYIYLADQWDTFKHSKDNFDEVLGYKYFIESDDMDSSLHKLLNGEENRFEQSENEDYTDKFISIGKYIKKYVDIKNKEKLSTAFESEIEGIKVLCVNADGNSLIFGDKIKEYDMVCLFNFDGSSKRWSYSLYSSDNSEIDCSTIAQKFGGGGHSHASGFSIEKCIF